MNCYMRTIFVSLYLIWLIPWSQSVLRTIYLGLSWDVYFSMNTDYICILIYLRLD